MTHIIIIALTVVDAMVALLLIGIVLIQQSKGGGFGGSTFGGLGESIFGGQAADHLTKVTVVLASLFLGLTLLLAVITGRRPLDKGVVEKEEPKTAEMVPAPSKEKPGEKAPAALGAASKDAKSAESAAVKVVEGTAAPLKPKPAEAAGKEPAVDVKDKEPGKENDKKASAPEK